MDEELTALIVEELGKRHDRQVIIHKIRERNGSSWKQAQQMIRCVEMQNRKAIAARQSPRVFLLSIIALALGMGLVAFNLPTLLAFARQDMVLSLPWHNPGVIESLAGIAITIIGIVWLWKGLAFIFPD
jgi:hypothetical protein